jgi:hypothetical protein
MAGAPINNPAINGTIEAYKAIIDFNKVIISISSTVLAALIAYLAYQKVEFHWINYVSSFFLVLSIFFSITGFGNAIATIKDGISRRGTILMSNFGASILILGILSMLLIRTNNEGLDDILKSVESSTNSLNKNLSPKNCIRIELKDDYYLIDYKADTISTKVIYSIKKGKITLIK